MNRNSRMPNEVDLLAIFNAACATATPEHDDHDSFHGFGDFSFSMATRRDSIMLDPRFMRIARPASGEEHQN